MKSEGWKGGFFLFLLIKKEKWLLVIHGKTPNFSFSKMNISFFFSCCTIGNLGWDGRDS